MKKIELRDCRCGAKPGEMHEDGCDVEKCALCMMQVIACDCIYELNGMSMETLEEEHPEIFMQGPTEEMYPALEREVERVGGRMPWTGEYPGSAECRELGFWCRWVEGQGWVDCEANHPEAREHLNRLYESCTWDAEKRKWEYHGSGRAIRNPHLQRSSKLN
jgi:hypothetical protein